VSPPVPTVTFTVTTAGETFCTIVLMLELFIASEPRVTGVRILEQVPVEDAKIAPVLLSTHAFTTGLLKVPAAVATPPTIPAPKTNPKVTFAVVVLMKLFINFYPLFNSIIA
jgi:hypothetical protein